MFRKSAIPILTFICIVYNALAQDYLKLGPSLESKNTDRTYALIYYDSNGYALMRSDKDFKYAETETYDKNLKLLNSFVSTPEHRNYGGVLNLEGRLFMLFSKYRLNAQLEQYEDVSLWAMPMNKDSFCVGKDSFALVEPFTLKSALYRGNFVLSPDRSKLLVYDWEEEGDIDEVKGLTNEIMLRVYDNRFKLLWSRKVYLAPNSSGKRVMSIKKLRVGNSGEAAILTDYFRNHRSYSLKEVTADPTVFFVGEKASDFSRLTPNLGNLFFNELNFMYDAEGNIIWFGFYSNRKYHEQAGYFYIKINAARNKILSKKISSFDQEIMTSLLKKKIVKKLDELRNFEIAFFKISKNGDLIVSAERRPYGIANYKSHDILLLRFDSSGNLLWSKYIFKYNIFPQSLKVFLNHYLQIDNENIYLLFNQGIYSETGLAKALKIERNGNLTEKVVMNYLNAENVFCPTLSSPLPDGKTFINLQSRFFKYHQSGILDFRKLFEEKN
jgi:hypothetical protein